MALYNDFSPVRQWNGSAGVTCSGWSATALAPRERSGKRDGKKGKEIGVLESGLSVLGEAIPAVHRSSFSRLEGHFAFLTAVRTDRLEHLTGAAGEIVPRTANSVAVHYVTYAVLTLHAYVRGGSINMHALSPNPVNEDGIPEYTPKH